MRLRAKVNTVVGSSTNYIGTITQGQPVPVQQLPDPTWLEISTEGNACLLLYLDADGRCFADSWHQTLEAAQREALLGFAIRTDEWTEALPKKL
jgi:hypothetical protein